MSTVEEYPKEILVRRVMDSYDSISDMLDAVGCDKWVLIEYLIEARMINEDTMPHIFDEYYTEEGEFDDE
jgi:hypothetical protein